MFVFVCMQQCACYRCIPHLQYGCISDASVPSIVLYEKSCYSESVQMCGHWHGAQNVRVTAGEGGRWDEGMDGHLWDVVMTAVQPHLDHVVISLWCWILLSRCHGWRVTTTKRWLRFRFFTVSWTDFIYLCGAENFVTCILSYFSWVAVALLLKLQIQLSLWT